MNEFDMKTTESIIGHMTVSQAGDLVESWARYQVTLETPSLERRDPDAFEEAVEEMRRIGLRNLHRFQRGELS